MNGSGSVSEAERIAGELGAEDRRLLLDVPSDWHNHFDASEVISMGRLGGLGLVSFQNTYEGPAAMLTDLGREVARILSEEGK